jgi:YidC/Oxa1 family membrane protein insertase
MQRNYILFVVLSVLVMGGWLWIEQNYLRPPPQAKKEQTKAPPRLTPKEEAIALGAGLIGEQGMAGTLAGGPWLLALESLKAYVPPPARWAQIAEPLRPALFLLPTAPLPALALVAQLNAAVPAAAAPPVITRLGGDGYHLDVNLTSLGAGVRSLTLRQFQGANYLGRPTNEPLELIPDDPIQPSYLLHHFADAKAKNPVLGLGQALWEFKGKEMLQGGVQQATYTTLVPNLPVRLTKIYRLGPKDYHIGLLLKIEDDRERSAEGITLFRYQMAGAHGLPIEGEWYTQMFRNTYTLVVHANGQRYRVSDDSTNIAFRDGALPVPNAPRGDSMVQYAVSANQYFAAGIVVDNEQPSREEGGVPPASILAFARATRESEEHPGYFLGIQGNVLHFKVADHAAKKLVLRSYQLLPRVQHHIEKELELKENDRVVIYAYPTPAGEFVATWARRGHAERPQLDDVTNRVTSEVVELKPGRSVSHQFMLYHGPVKTAQLGTFSGDAAVPPALVERYTHTLNLDTMIDWPSNWFVQKIYFTDLVIFFTKLMHWLLNGLYGIVRNYGISIVLLTVIVRGAMFPISRRQAMFSVKMQELAPELKKIGEKHKNDPQARTQATMELYRKHNIHPLGSCLPMLLQLPIFLGLYFALQESIHFRLAPFLWMPNLAAPDMLFWWGEYIPWISDPDSQGGFFYLGPYFNLLPVVAVVLMVVQQQLMMPPPTDEQQEVQQKMMKYMSIFFGVLFYKMAAGLCIYFIATSLWGLGERRLLPRRQPSGPSAPPSGKGPPPTGKGPPPPGKGPPRPKPKPRGPIPKEEQTAMDKLKGWWAEVLEQARKK